MSGSTRPRYAHGSLELAEVGADCVRSLDRSKPALFDGHLISAGLGVPDDTDMIVEADYAAASEIGLADGMHDAMAARVIHPR